MLCTVDAVAALHAVACWARASVAANTAAGSPRHNAACAVCLALKPTGRSLQPASNTLQPRQAGKPADTTSAGSLGPSRTIISSFVTDAARHSTLSSQSRKPLQSATTMLDVPKMKVTVSVQAAMR